VTERKEDFASRLIRLARTIPGFISRYRWPIGLVGIILCFFIADGVLIATALRDYDAIKPQDGYYERAVNHDEIRERMHRAEIAGLKAEIEVAEAPIPTMPRRVDVLVRDGNGAPVPGLKGKLTAIRPADARLRNDGKLVAVPGRDGLYRLLLKVPVAGLWEFQLDAHRGSDDYLMIVRQDVEI